MATVGFKGLMHERHAMGIRGTDSKPATNIL